MPQSAMIQYSGFPLLYIRKKVRADFLQGEGKVREFSFWSGKSENSTKRQRNVRKFCSWLQYVWITQE